MEYSHTPKKKPGVYHSRKGKDITHQFSVKNITGNARCVFFGGIRVREIRWFAPAKHFLNIFMTYLYDPYDPGTGNAYFGGKRNNGDICDLRSQGTSAD